MLGINPTFLFLCLQKLLLLHFIDGVLKIILCDEAVLFIICNYFLLYWFVKKTEKEVSVSILRHSLPEGVSESWQSPSLLLSTTDTL